MGPEIYFMGGAYRQRGPAGGEVVPTVAAHPADFIDGAERPQAPWGSLGKIVPTVAAPESPPDQAVIPVNHPDHSRSLLPATHPYWE